MIYHIYFTLPQKLYCSSTTVLKYYCNWTRTHNHWVRKRTLNHLVWLNGWVFVYELSGCGFESCCSHLNFRYRTCFEQGFSWHSANYRVWIHSKMRTWHDKNRQLDLPYSDRWLGTSIEYYILLLILKIFLRFN